MEIKGRTSFTAADISKILNLYNPNFEKDSGNYNLLNFGPLISLATLWIVIIPCEISDTEDRG
jgi:hypothetical protein